MSEDVNELLGTEPVAETSVATENPVAVSEPAKKRGRKPKAAVEVAAVSPEASNTAAEPVQSAAPVDPAIVVGLDLGRPDGDKTIALVATIEDGVLKVQDLSDEAQAEAALLAQAGKLKYAYQRARFLRKYGKAK